MLHNYYHVQKMAEEHRNNLMREAEQERLAAELPHKRNGIAAKLGMFFTMLGTNLKQLGRKTTGTQDIPIGAPLSMHSPHH